MKYEEWKMDKIAVLIPCYNEEEALPETARQLGEKVPAPGSDLCIW